MIHTIKTSEISLVFIIFAATTKKDRMSEQDKMAMRVTDFA